MLPKGPENAPNPYVSVYIYIFDHMPSVALGCAARLLDLQGFMQWFRFHNINVGNPVINLPFGDGVYHPFVVILLDSLLKLLKVHLT